MLCFIHYYYYIIFHFFSRPITKTFPQVGYPHTLSKTKLVSSNLVRYFFPYVSETCFDGVCWMDDKVFTSANCSSVSEAKVKVSLMALEYLNVPVDKQTGLGEFVVKMINGNLNLRFSAPSISPFQKTPSMAMSWLHKCVVADTSPSHYNGENINVDVIKEKMNIHFTAE